MLPPVLVGSSIPCCTRVRMLPCLQICHVLSCLIDLALSKGGISTAPSPAAKKNNAAAHNASPAHSTNGKPQQPSQQSGGHHQQQHAQPWYVGLEEAVPVAASAQPSGAGVDVCLLEQAVRALAHIATLPGGKDAIKVRKGQYCTLKT